MSSWPVGLQQKLNAKGFTKKLGKTTVRTEMDVGPAKVRSRFTDAVDTYSSSILLDFAENATFETFYKTTLNNGALTFEFLDPFTETIANFRFAEEPDIRALGGRTFEVSLLWEKLP